MQDDPLTPDEVAAFLDGQLDGAELARVESHLAENPGSRQEIIKASRILSSMPKRDARRWPRRYAFIGLAAAAAIAVVIIRPGDTELRRPVSVERRSTVDEPDKIELISPANAHRLTGRGDQLVWRSIKGATYYVVISDTSGNTVFRTSTSDTSLIIPQSITAAGTYYWRVDGQTPDGSSVPSDIKEFVISGK